MVIDQKKSDKIIINSKAVKITKETVEALLKLISVDVGYTVKHDKDGDSISVDIDAGEYAGILIGKKGETIDSLQTIISTIIKNKCGGWLRVYLNVSDWRQKQNDRLVQLAKITAERVKQTGEPQSMFNLDASQRRIVHMAISEDKDLLTESIGEGKDRYLVVKLAK